MNRLHVHVPWRQIDEHLPFLLEHRLQPELALLASDLDQTAPARFTAVGQALSAHQLELTVHAPFMDLNPGASDPLIATATRQRLEQTLGAASRLGAHLVVVHPGYDHWRYNGNPQLWLDQALPMFRQLLGLAERCAIRIAVENIFEASPGSLCILVDTLAHPLFGHCFDIGHWQLFGGAVPQADWLQLLGDRLFHLHLHDNSGTADDHLPLGEGRIDFRPLADALSRSPYRPSATLEAHNRERLLRSLAALPMFFPGYL